MYVCVCVCVSVSVSVCVKESWDGKKMCVREKNRDTKDIEQEKRYLRGKKNFWGEFKWWASEQHNDFSDIKKKWKSLDAKKMKKEQMKKK